MSAAARNRLRRLASAGIALGATCSFLLLGAAPAATADDAALAIEPPQGTVDDGVLRLITNRACPGEATNFLVQISGGSFPPNSNAIGNTELDGFFPPKSGDGLVIPMLGSWNVTADANGYHDDLDGLARMTLVCLSEDGSRILSKTTGEVRFFQSEDGPVRYEQVGGPHLESWLPLKASDVPYSGEYVYRSDLPPGSPGGPPVGTDSVVKSDVAAGSAGDAETASDSDAQTATGDRTQAGDTALSSSERGSRSASKMPLLVGAGLLVAAAAAGFVVYSRARPEGSSL